MGVLLDRRSTTEDDKMSRQLYGGLQRQGKGLMEEATLELSIEK